MVVRVSVQHDGIVYLQLGCIVVGRYARIPQNVKVRRGTLRHHPELAAIMLFFFWFCLPVRRGDLDHGPLRVRHLVQLADCQ